MKLNLSKYSSLIKILIIIPVTTGFLTLSDLVLPEKEITTEVISKKESYRAKFDKTTYNIYFSNNNDQFTKDVFEALSKGDKVITTVSFFTKEISKIKLLKTGKEYTKDTSESYFVYGLGLLFLITGFTWLKQSGLNSKESKFLIIIIFISAFSRFRILSKLQNDETSPPKNTLNDINNWISFLCRPCLCWSWR